MELPSYQVRAPEEPYLPFSAFCCCRLGSFRVECTSSSPLDRGRTSVASKVRLHSRSVARNSCQWEGAALGAYQQTGAASWVSTGYTHLSPGHAPSVAVARGGPP